MPAPKALADLACVPGRPTMAHPDYKQGRTAWLAVRLIVEHELMEHFTVAGRRLFDPHSPNTAGD